jgi:HK97 family phage major capsid protein
MATINGVEINLTPTEAMQVEAQRYRDWKAEGQAGGTDVAARRASQILSGDELSPDTVITMSAWFARHEVDKQGEGFSPGEDGYPSPGRVAWAAWGGDPGKTWSDRRAEQVKDAQDRGAKADEDDDTKLSESPEKPSGATTPLSGEDTMTTPPNEELERSAAQPIDLLRINKEGLRREVSQGVRVEDSTDQGLTFSFSSEAPVERWWGKEVLMHDEGAMDLGRMNDGGAYLWNHNRDVVLGVAEKAWLGADRRLYTTVKWSPNTMEKGTEEYKRRRDIEAGITRNVSFAYEIADMREAANGDMQVTKWNVLEVSSVSVPADQSVGLGRALSSGEEAGAAHTAEELMQPDNVMLGTKQSAERGTEATSPAPLNMEQSIDIQEVQSAARAAERDRVAVIRAMCAQHQVGDEMADRLINDDASIDQARETVLTQLGRTRKEFQGRLHDDGAGSIGLTSQEVKRYSLMNVIRHLADPSDRATREAASFELDCSKAAEAKLGRAAKGVVMPWDVMASTQQRAPQAAGTASSGGYLVDTTLLTGSFIDLVRNRSALLGLNVTTLTGLTGNVDIPKKTGNTTAYWVGEDVAVSETNIALGQISMTPKSLGGYVDITRRLMQQSSMDVEALVRADLAESIALAIDSSGIYGLGGSSALLGIKNITGVGTETLTSVADTNKAIGGVTYYFGNFSDYVNMETTVSVANLDVNSMFYVGNAHVRGALKQTLRNTNSEMFIWDNNEVNGYGARVSNQLIGSNVLFGDFSQAIFGFWSGVDITVDPYTNSTKGTTRIVAFQDVDFGVRNPGAFVFGSGNA